MHRARGKDALYHHHTCLISSLAMSIGDPASAKAMADILINAGLKMKLLVDGISAQISREYNISVPLSSIPPARTYTQEEIQASVDLILNEKDRISEHVLRGV